MPPLKRLLYSLCLSIVCSACAPIQPSFIPTDALPPFQLDLTIPEHPPSSIIEPFITAGLRQLHTGAYEEAGQQFRRALALQPQNVAVNFLNALTYHLLGSQGDHQRFDSADVGYQMALRFDPQAWWAAYYYGALELERRHYLEAQDLFAQAVKLRPDEGQLLLGLAIASYYTGDLDVAVSAIQRARNLSADDTPLLRPSALISAALGDDEQARRFAEQYQLTPVHPLQVAQLQHRLQDWQRVYAQVDISQGDQTPLPATATPPVVATTETGPRQIIIDVVIIRSIRSHQRSRGINLLEGLNLQYSYSKTTTTTTDTQESPVEFVTKTVTKALGIPEITYSLNIFNTTDSLIEIVARPSLLATEGKKSSFFSGSLFIASLQGTLEASALSERVGVSLSLTPTFLSDEEFLLEVNIKDADFTPGSVPGTFEQALLVSIAETSVNARIRFGQTLLLAGLIERQEIQFETKVPILGDIPLIQTIFKHKEEEHVVTETMILLTPRRAIDVVKQPMPAHVPAGQAKPVQSGSQRVDDLLHPHLQPFTPTSNYHHLLFHLSQSEYFQQFRRGDLQLEMWETRSRLKALWDEVMAYVYY